MRKDSWRLKNKSELIDFTSIYFHAYDFKYEEASKMQNFQRFVESLEEVFNPCSIDQRWACMYHPSFWLKMLHCTVFCASLIYFLGVHNRQ